MAPVVGNLLPAHFDVSRCLDCVVPAAGRPLVADRALSLHINVTLQKLFVAFLKAQVFPSDQVMYASEPLAIAIVRAGAFDHFIQPPDRSMDLHRIGVPVLLSPVI